MYFRSRMFRIFAQRGSLTRISPESPVQRITRNRVIAGDSQCFWLLLSLLVQLKEDGFRPSDPVLFDKNISALSAALAAQTTVAAGLNRFCHGQALRVLFGSLFLSNCGISET